jgi:hypothetical protein
MDIEQLKLVLETLQSVSHEAGSLAVLWMWLKFGAAAVGHLSIMVVIVVVAYFIYNAVRMSYGDDAYERFFRDMRDQLRTGTGGCLTGTERDNTMAAIRALVADNKAQKRTP